MSGGIVLPKPVIGYREWNVEDGRLRPRFRPQAKKNPWERPRGTITAECRETGGIYDTEEGDLTGHPAGTEGCRCGLYGLYEVPEKFKTPILERVPPAANDGPRRPRIAAGGRVVTAPPVPGVYELYDKDIVFGVFVGFGKVTYCRRGFRSEKGRIVALRWSPAAEEIAGLYELPLCDTAGELTAEAMRWGEVYELPPNLPAEPERFHSGGWLSGSALGSSGGFGALATSHYRNIYAQTALAMQHLGKTMRVRAIVNLTLALGVEVTWSRSIMDFDPLGKVTVKGLDQEAWTIRNVIQSCESPEVPLPGQHSMSMRRGVTRIELELEGCFSREDLKKALDGLRQIGQCTQVAETMIV